MERRTGNMIEKYADENMRKECQMAYEKEIMKMCFAENIAGSGLALGHLKTIFDRNGEDGLMCVFT